MPRHIAIVTAPDGSEVRFSVNAHGANSAVKKVVRIMHDKEIPDGNYEVIHPYGQRNLNIDMADYPLIKRKL